MEQCRTQLSALQSARSVKFQFVFRFMFGDEMSRWMSVFVHCVQFAKDLGYDGYIHGYDIGEFSQNILIPSCMGHCMVTTQSFLCTSSGPN